MEGDDVVWKWQIGGKITSVSLFNGNWFALLQLSTSSSLGLAEHRLLRFLMKIHPIAYGNHTDVHFYDTVMDTVPVRIYLPRAKERSTNGRGVVFFHGGGWSVWNPGKFLF